MVDVEKGEIAGSVCVVTGGARGLGAAIAETLAREGGQIAILDRDGDAAVEMQSRLQTSGRTARAYQVDITDEARVVAAAQEITSDFGGVDVLVNNAGISRLGPSMTFSLEDWNESLSIMCTGVFLCSREFGKALRER